MSYIWSNSRPFDSIDNSFMYTTTNTNWLKQVLKQKLADIHDQNWLADVNSNSSCKLYRIFKNSIELENYLCSFNPPERTFLCKLRCSNFKIPSVVGRYEGIAFNERTCHMCNGNKLGDEYHYLFECKTFQSQRTKYIKPFFWRRPSTVKFEQLMNSKSRTTQHNLIKFSYEINQIFK